jgi:hypothetical protein
MKCDIVSFDYSGFGCSSGKPDLDSLLMDGEDVINFTISYLKYKIENIILFGKGIGSMSAIYLASRQNYYNLKGLILCMPEIGNKIIDIKVMRSIICQTLLIMEFENKDEIDDNEIINLCREIPNEKEWFPLRKKNTKNLNFLELVDYFDDYEDVYSRHRGKFILKIKDYIYLDKDNTQNRKKSSTIGGSTDSDSIKSMSLGKSIGNKKILNSINFIEKYNDKKNENQINENDNEKGRPKKKDEFFNDTEIEINNDEDY